MIKSPILCTPEKSEVLFCFISFFKEKQIWFSFQQIPFSSGLGHFLFVWFSLVFALQFIHFLQFQAPQWHGILC